MLTFFDYPDKERKNGTALRPRGLYFPGLHEGLRWRDCISIGCFGHESGNWTALRPRGPFLFRSAGKGSKRGRFARHFGSGQLGDYYLNRSGMVDMPEEWKAGVDVARLGEHIAKEEQGAFTDYGYLVKSGDEWQRVHEGQPVPEEYRVMSYPAPEILRDEAPAQPNFSIYQVPPGPEERNFRYRSYEELQADGLSVDRANYQLVYTAPMEKDASLDGIYHRFNVAIPADYKGHALSMGDVVVFRQDG